ncbi:hypothetical protein CHKEEEPN_4931 [Methylorubrum podarium]|nr:hypothetical protein CHKEEEPN_4931 [Methylorubrum podarium]
MVVAAMHAGDVEPELNEPVGVLLTALASAQHSGFGELCAQPSADALKAYKIGHGHPHRDAASGHD